MAKGIRQRIGHLRHKVTIQEDTGTTRNAANERTADWTTLDGGSVWASVEPLRGRELIEAQQMHANVSHRVTCRHVSGVTPAMRVRHDSRTLNITSVANVFEQDWKLELLCTEAV